MRSRRRDRRPLLLAALFDVLLLSSLAAWPAVRTALCPSILIASSNEKAVLMADLAHSYSVEHRNAWAGCGDVVRVEQVASGDAERELSHGWTDAGTRPDVWAPAATTWVDLLRQAVAGKPYSDQIPPDPLPSIATSPLVVAMPDKMAKALGWPHSQPTWHDLFELASSPEGWASRGHPELGPFRLAKTDPTKSTSGIHTLLAEYYAATGESTNLQRDDLSRPETLAFMRTVEQSVSHYAPTAGDFLKALSASADGSSYISAIPIEEQEVYNYNKGVYSASGLATTNTLDAVYPAGGTFFADHPYVVLSAVWVDDAKRTLAAAYLKWLQEPAQQAQFANAGFRSFDHTAGGELAQDPGLIPGQPTQTLGLPLAPGVLTAVERSWQAFRKGARIVLVLDLASAEQQAAVLESIGSLGPKDEVGVWSSSQPEPLAAIQAVSSPLTAAAIKSAPLTRGPTDLYATIQLAYAQLSQTPDPTRINAIVVIAAGRDAGRGPSLTTLERLLLLQTSAVPIRVYTVAVGGADRAALGDIERAGGGVASNNADAATAIRTCLANF